MVTYFVLRWLIERIVSDKYFETGICITFTMVSFIGLIITGFIVMSFSKKGHKNYERYIALIISLFAMFGWMIWIPVLIDFVLLIGIFALSIVFFKSLKMISASVDTKFEKLIRERA